MTTSTTDAEAIARIIDPDGFRAYDEAKATGRLADNGKPWACFACVGMGYVEAPEVINGQP